MMYWKSKATNVYIRVEYIHMLMEKHLYQWYVLGGFARRASVYNRPEIEDIIPYMDDTKGGYFHNTKRRAYLSRMGTIQTLRE